jgi:hypothetical protein
MRFAAVINREASTLKTADLDRIAEKLGERFSSAGHAVDIAFVEGGEMPEAVRRAVDSSDADAVLAGGGDGTISMAAGLLQGTDKALAILPGGNMNLFARSLGIPLDLDAAIDALASGRPQKADIAFANERPFIHEFSLGLHPEMIEMRDLVGDLAQQVVDAVQARALLVVALDDVPGRLGDVGALEGLLLGLGVGSQRTRDCRSIGLSFHCFSGSWMRIRKRSCCSSSVIENQYLISRMPERTSMRSNSGTSWKNCST